MTRRAAKSAVALLVAVAALGLAHTGGSAAPTVQTSCNVNEDCVGAGVLTPEVQGGGDMLTVDCGAVAASTTPVVQTGVACSVTGANGITYWGQAPTAATWLPGNQVSQNVVLHNVPAQAYTICVQGNYETVTAWEPGWTAGACSTLVV